MKALVRATVGQTMDQPRIAVKSEDDGAIGGENTVVLLVGQPMRMQTRRLQSHEVNNIDDTNFDVGDMLAQPIHGGKSLQSRYVAGAGHNHIGLTALIVTGPLPYAHSRRAMLDSFAHTKPL